jgi:hypothetical protein
VSAAQALAHEADSTCVDLAHARLWALVRERVATPFAWGQHDCCLWAADAVLAVTGHDHAAAHRGSYRTATSAARRLQALGGLCAVAAQVGPAVPPLATVDGDIGLVQRDDRQLLAVRVAGVWLAPGPTGLAAVSSSAVSQAWSVRHG